MDRETQPESFEEKAFDRLDELRLKRLANHTRDDDRVRPYLPMRS